MLTRCCNADEISDAIRTSETKKLSELLLTIDKLSLLSDSRFMMGIRRISAAPPAPVRSAIGKHGSQSCRECGYIADTLESREVEGSMVSEVRSTRLAVLIDADNATARIAGRLFEEIAKIGEASVRRIYGDFSGPRLKPWADILAQHAIIPQQQFAYTAGKNSSDIALVIDAMDLLHSGRFDGFCLVSSDSDFTRLASRIREQGVDVYGFGEQKTPESFRQACRRFI
jgi:hypothetical protein